MATHRLEIPDWHPATLNQLLSGHWARRARLKRADRELVAVMARQRGVPKAAGRRGVSLVVRLGKGQRAPDKDAYWKSLLDSLTACGLLVDDSPRWCEPGVVIYSRDLPRATVIELTDLPGVAG